MGVLVLRVWREPESAPGILRARLIGGIDGGPQDVEVGVADGIDDIVGMTRRWLESFPR